MPKVHVGGPQWLEVFAAPETSRPGDSLWGVNWLVVSIVASVVLTVVLNVAIRAFPGAASRGARQLDDWAARQPARELWRDGGRVRVVVPWKAMLLVSALLPVLLNVLIRR